MGGDCSQKLLLRRGWHSSPGRSRSSDQYAIHNSIAKMGSLRTRLSGVRFSPPAAARLSAFPEISFPEPVLFPTAGRSVSSLFETSSTAAVSSRRHRTLAAWSPPVRRNGSLSRRR